MNEKKKRHFLEIAIMGLILIISILIVSRFSTHQFNSHEVRVRNFFAMEDNTIDVVNIGASEIYTGFSPEYLWENHGITSYNLATAGAPMGLAENQIKVALKTQKPKLFVVSINGAQYNDKRATAEGYVRMWVDNIPESELRQEAIDRLVEGDKTAYKYKFLKYHSNILRLPEAVSLEMREHRANKDKRLLTVSGIDGFVSVNKEPIADEDIYPIENFTEREALGKKTQKQLDELLDFLEKEKIDNVVFVNMPTYFTEKRKKDFKLRKKQNEAISQIEARGFKVYDFTKEMDAIGLDSHKDFYNWGHLNILGQEKMTEYFYNRVLKDMNFKSDISQETAKKWDENYDYYKKFYDWAKNIIETEGPSKMKYDYAIIDHLENDTLESYEKKIRFKSEIVKKNDKGNEKPKK